MQLPWTRGSRAFRLPRMRVAAVMIAVSVFSACSDDPLMVAGSRTFAVVLADGKPLPSVYDCPVRFGEGSEAWVTFGGGTLVLHSDGTYMLTYTVGEGYSYHCPVGVKQGRGWTTSEYGSYTIDQASSFTLYRSGTQLRVGRMTDAVVELESTSMTCPQAPAGTPPHTFALTLR
jgi:hypothetical protein